jgi:hypothetical protein
MADVLGPLTLQNKALPTGVDGARLAQWAMRDGITYGELVNRVALALGAANQALVDKWGFLFSITDEFSMEYGTGGAINPMTELTDIDKHPLVHGSTIGHMLPLKFYGEAVGGTWRYFRDVRSAQIQAAITTIVNRGIWRFEQKLLTRFFTNTENAIGSGGYDVPFVRGSGGNVDFAPMSYDGETFDTTHDHFLAYDKDTGPETLDDVLEGLAATLAEHGHMAPFTALVSRDDIATLSALTNFVTIVDPGITVIDRGGGTTGSGFFARGQRDIGRIGWYQSNYGLIELVASARIPADYVGMTKSYGNLNPRNSLAVRTHPDQGFGFFIVTKTSENLDWPIEQVDVGLEFGVGVGADRTNGAAAILVNDDTWANPTIT